MNVLFVGEGAKQQKGFNSTEYFADKQKRSIIV